MANGSNLQLISGNSQRSRVLEDDVTKDGFVDDDRVDVFDDIEFSVCRFSLVSRAHVGRHGRDVITSKRLGSLSGTDADDLIKVPELFRPLRPIDGDVVVGFHDPTDLLVRIGESLQIGSTVANI